MKKNKSNPSLIGFGLLFIIIPLLYVGSSILYYQFNEQWDYVETAMLSMFFYYIACSTWWLIFSVRKKKQFLDK